MSSSDDKAPKESWSERVQRFMATGHAHLHASVASAVDGLNRGLVAAEESTLKIRAPVNQAWRQASDIEKQVEHQLHNVYQKRHEIGPQAVGGAALAGGLLAQVRRRSVLGFVTGSVLGASLAYLAVYEPLPVKKIPDLVLEQLHLKGKKED